MPRKMKENKSSKKSTKINKLTSPEYAAGLMDAEGSVTILHENPGYSLLVRISNNNRHVKKLLREKYGGSLPPSGIDWQLRANKAAAFLTKIYPFLVVKKKRAKLGINFQNTKENKSLRKQREYKQKITKLNKDRSNLFNTQSTKVSNKYAAGFLDGDGCIFVTKNGSLQTGIFNTHKKIVNSFKKQFKGNLSPSKKRGKIKCWTCRIPVAEQLNFLRKISPHLIIKNKQAKLAMDLQREKINLKKADSKTKPKEKARRQRIRKQISKLNQA